jgi:hypothetical protein
VGWQVYPLTLCLEMVKQALLDELWLSTANTKVGQQRLEI